MGLRLILKIILNRKHNQVLDSIPSNDLKLVKKCVSGDRGAAEIFVREYSDIIYRSIQHTLIVKHIKFTMSDLEDIHNTVFLQLFEKKRRKLKQYQGKNGCSLKTWLRVVTVRIVLNHIRKKGFDSISRHKKQVDLEALTELKTDEITPLAMMEKSEQSEFLKQKIEMLSARDQVFLKLHFIQELSIFETSEIMGISAQNAYTLKHRAIKKLQDYVGSNREKPVSGKR